MSDVLGVDVFAHAKSRSTSRAARRSRKDYIVGIGLLLVVVVLWTTSNFVTQGLFEDGFEKPFLVTYLGTSSFAFYLLPYVVRRLVPRHTSEAEAAHIGRQVHVNNIPPCTDQYELGDARAISLCPDGVHGNAHEDDMHPLTTSETAQLSAWFCFLWFIANWTLNASLDYTSVASATILSSMSGFFTLAIGRLFRVESLTVVKIAAVLTSFSGVLLVSLSDGSQDAASPDPSPSANVVRLSSRGLNVPLLIGDTLALLSALFYALYVILLKVRIRSESRIDMQLFFGFVGLFNILATWPIGVVLHFTGIEKFELPHTTKVITAILINMAITLSSDYIYVIAMLKTTPLVVTIGLSLTMPLAVFGDFVLQKPVKFQVILGAMIVLGSFVAVGLEDQRNEEEQDLLSGRPLEEDGNSDVRLEEEPHSEHV
ncbi:hypothetical protein K474DRAFT_1590154 [Panus rudis PR-1116 ss-1]|nr:hypothetical protein K474DRAFT_1590154 [Panus rudis PR-1116 ss-1]